MNENNNPFQNTLLWSFKTLDIKEKKVKLPEGKNIHLTSGIKMSLNLSEGNLETSKKDKYLKNHENYSIPSQITI